MVPTGSVERINLPHLLRGVELREELVRHIDEPEQVFVDQPNLSRAGLAFIKARTAAFNTPQGVRGVDPNDPARKTMLAIAARTSALTTESVVRRLVEVTLTPQQLDAVVAYAVRVGVDAFRTSSVLADLNAGRLAQAAAAMSPEERAVFEQGEYGDVPDDEEIDFDREIPKPIVGSIETVLDGQAVVRSGAPDFSSLHTTIPKYTRVRIDALSVDEAYVKVSKLDGTAIGWTVRSNLGGYFKDDPKLAVVPLAPAVPLAIDASWPDKKKAIANVFNRLGGLMNAVVAQTGVPLPAVLAVWMIESGGRSHEVGKAIIRFENHLLWHRWGDEHASTYDQHFQRGGHAGVGGSSWQNHKWRPDAGEWRTFHGTQSKEYEVLGYARSLCGDTPALSSISIGGPQILISNRRLIGYENEVAMYDAFQADERFHVLGFFDYCQYAAGHLSRRRELLRHLRARRWTDFARGYNGSGQADAYGDMLEGAYDRAASLPFPEQPSTSQPPPPPPPSHDEPATPLLRLRLPTLIRRPG